MNHTLKIMPVYFNAVMTGDKNFEIRENTQRDFQRGDTVELREYNVHDRTYTGRAITANISYVTNFQQRDNYVVFGMQNIQLVE